MLLKIQTITADLMTALLEDISNYLLLEGIGALLLLKLMQDHMQHSYIHTTLQ